jgi:hypothetical protein
VTTAALCDVPCGQFDVALVAWRERSVEALGITINGLAPFVSTAGFLVLWVAARDQIQSLRLALHRLGFRIEARTECELGVILCTRRAEPLAAVA